MVTLGFLQEMSNPDAGCGLVLCFPELCLLFHRLPAMCPAA